MQYHLENCPSRSVVDKALVEQKSGQNCVAAPLPKHVVQSILPESEESWEDVSVESNRPSQWLQYVPWHSYKIILIF